MGLNGEWNLQGAARRKLSDREFMATRLHAGDLVITKSSGSARHLGKTALVTREVAELGCSFSNFMQRLRLRKGYDARFYYYLLNCAVGREQLLYLGSTTTGLANLSGTMIGNVVAPDPPIAEQGAIADFLDRETAKIDRLIEDKQRLIELLEEKRTALITQAVTKGRDPDVEMKDSGVEWLGDIPAHWDVARIKHLARLETGHTPSRQEDEYWRNCTIPWFGLADVWQIRDGRREEVTETKEKVSELGLRHSSARLLPAGTVMLSRTASVGFSAIMGVDMATTQDFVNWTCGPKLRPSYLLYVFRAMQPEFRRITMGSTHQTIYMPDVHQLLTPGPPVLEQEAIVEQLRPKLRELDSLVNCVEQGIILLREYRSALISAAVTGKIDVREEAA